MTPAPNPRRIPAYREGVEAASRGEDRSANPYVPDTDSGWAWAEGWGDYHAACRLYRARGEAA
jgi:hypothetical protein